MRKLILASLSLVLVACAGGDDAAIDTTAAVIEPAAPAMTPNQSMYAGTWAGRSHRAGAPASDTGSKWTMTFTAADTGLTGIVRFDGQTTDVPIRVDEVSDAGMRTTFGPYMSALAGNVEVTTTTDGRFAGDSLFGSFVATPTTGDRVSGRFAARRQ